MNKKVPIITGPTVSGKTALSLLLAKELKGEIISADSRQFYKDMDIGTAKIRPEEQEGIPHHFIDILEPSDYYSAGMFAGDAREKISELQEKGICPIVVGGSGLYIKALTEGIFEFDADFEPLRKTLLERVDAEGLQTLYAELKAYDPAYAEKVSANDKQRITRALEVFLATGRTFTDWHNEKTEPADFEPVFIGLKMEREILYERINKRVDKMIEDGLIEEVKALQEKGFTSEMNALNTVGYKEVFAHLSGELNRYEMSELIKRNTRRYAKRQMTWFKSQTSLHWFEVSDENSLPAICEKIINLLPGV